MRAPGLQKWYVFLSSAVWLLRAQLLSCLKIGKLSSISVYHLYHLGRAHHQVALIEHLEYSMENRSYVLKKSTPQEIL
jgi:hypothetical protein